MTIIRVEKKFHHSYTALYGWSAVEDVVRNYVKAHPNGEIVSFAEAMLVEAREKLKTEDEWDSYDMSAQESHKRELQEGYQNEELEGSAIDFCVYNRAKSVYGVRIRTMGGFKFPPGDIHKYLELPVRIMKKYFVPPWEESPEPRVLQGGYIFLIPKHDKKRWFTIDFEPMLRALDSVLDVRGIKGEDVAQKMLAVIPANIPIRPRQGDRLDTMDSDDTFVLQNKDGTEVTLRPHYGIREQHPRFDDWGPPGTRSVRGSIFKGQLHNHPLCHPKFPCFTIKLKPEKPIWEQEMERPLIELTENIEKALLPLVQKIK